MLQNAFVGRATRPTNKAAAAALGESYALWRRLIDELKREQQLDHAQWHTSSVKLGWSLRLQSNGRNILYLSPRAGFFVAAFILGDRAVAAARQRKLLGSVLKVIAQAKRYAEGTAVRIEVRKPEDLETVKALSRIKIEF